ncbi:MAG TPA: pyrroline-5-carboxylate reductase [Clostridiaceae bacterium]
MDKIQKNIGFIGGGQMGTALIGGFLAADLFDADQIYVMDILQSKLDNLNADYGITNASSNRETGYAYLVDNCDIILLAVKPQSLQEVLASIRNLKWKKDHLVVSIVGGAKTSYIEKSLGTTKVVRVIPNTPMLVGAGASSVSRGAYASEEDAQLVHKMFGELGVSFIVPENLIDPITALSGAGPAYVYMLIEAMADGGVEMGIPREIAQTLAAQTVKGAADMVLKSKEHPGRLKDNVCSPGGCTIAGVRALEKGGFRGIVMDAIEAGKLRMEEAGRKAEEE